MATTNEKLMAGSSKGISQMLKDAGNPDYMKKGMWDYVAKLNGLNSSYTVYGSKQYKIPTVGLSGVTQSTTKATSSATPTTTAPTTVNKDDFQNNQELTDWLNTYQTNKLSVLNGSEEYQPFSGEDVSSFAQDNLGMELDVPTAPKLEETYKQLRQDYDLDSSEARIRDLTDMKRNTEAVLRQRTGLMKEDQVRQSVISGRVDKVTQDMNEQIDVINRAVAYETDFVNSANSVIGMLMNLKTQDYTMAKESYSMEFNQRMSIYNALESTRQADREFAYKVLTDEQKMASTNLAIYTDLITSGSLQYKDIDSATLTEIHKMEVQSGLGLGFMSKVKAPAGSNIKQILQRTDPITGMGYADILYIDPDSGQLKIESQKIGQAGLSLAQQKALKYAGSSTSTATKTAQALSSATSEFNKAFGGYKIVDTGVSSQQVPVVGSDGKVAPDTYIELRSEWVSRGLSGSEFDERYAQKYVNSSHWQDYGGQLKNYFGSSDTF